MCRVEFSKIGKHDVTFIREMSAPEGNQIVSTFVAAAAGAAVAPSDAAYSGPTAASKIDGSSRHTVKEAGGVIAHWTVSRRL